MSLEGTTTAGCCITWLAGCWPPQVAPWLPPLSHPLLAAIQADRYYHLLVPLTVPVTIVAIAINWFSMKLFKHNS